MLPVSEQLFSPYAAHFCVQFIPQIAAANLNIYFPRSWLPARAAALLFISKSMLKLLYHVFRSMIDSRSLASAEGPHERTIPRPPLLRCGVLEIMNICAIIMGVETRIGINFHMISARHTRSQPANSNVELVRAPQIELCWAFPEHANHKERNVEM